MSDELPALIELERRDEGMVLRYQDGQKYELTYRELRLACPCAGCSPKRNAEESRTVFEQDVDRMKVEKPQASPVGGYALSFEWSEGCNSGIYTFERLYRLARGEDGDDGKPYIHGVW